MKKVKVSDLNLKKPSRVSRYQPLFDRLKKLKLGEAEVVQPKKKTSQSAANSIGMALRTKGAPPPLDGYRWTIRTQEDGSIAIFQVPRK